MTSPLDLPAPIWRRLAALVYDAFILLALSFLYGALLTAIATAAGSEARDYQPMFSGVLFPLGWVLTLAGFYCYFWHRSGQTVGMRTWHLKVVQEDGGRLPTFGQCVLRAAVAAPAVLLFGIGYLYGLRNSDRQTLQDRLSGTRVVLTPKPEAKLSRAAQQH